jgi:hypothetical protein
MKLIKKFAQLDKGINPDFTIRVGDKIIAKGDSLEESDKLNRIFINEVLKNTNIIEIVVDLLNRKSRLEKNVLDIRNMAIDISNLISSGYYRTKAQCCPSIFRLNRL